MNPPLHDIIHHPHPTPHPSVINPPHNPHSTTTITTTTITTTTITATTVAGDMHRLRRNTHHPSAGELTLHLTPTTASPLAIDVSETTHTRIQRLVSENPVVIFSRNDCYMCDVMKRLFYSIGVYPTVIQLDEAEIADLSAVHRRSGDGYAVAPAVFVGGSYVGGLENLVAIHLSGRLVSRLVEIGAISGVVL